MKMTSPEKQSIIEHLEELRRCLIICIVAVFVFSSIAFMLFSEDVILKMEIDLLDKYEGVKVIATSFMEAIMVRFKVSMFFGIYFSLPVIMYQFFRFVMPALYANERKSMLIILPASLILFTLGALFAYAVLLPVIVKFLIGFTFPIAEPYLKLTELISFIALFTFMMGVIFQWPLITAVLSNFGVVSPKTWSEKRRHAIVVCFIVGAFITDPTLVSQILVAIPMIILYEIGIITAKVVWRG